MIRTLVSFLVGIGCIMMVRSDWFTRRMEEKYAEFDDAPRRIGKLQRDWAIIGVFWILFGLAQIIIFY